MSGNTQATPIFHFSVETTQHVMINRHIFSQEHMKLSRLGTKVKLQSMVGVNFSLSNLTWQVQSALFDFSNFLAKIKIGGK